MRRFFTLLRHETRVLFIAPSTYVAAFLFLLIMGFVFQGVVETYSRSPQNSPPVVIFFQLFWLPVFFIVPLLTMKSFAEEKRHGTLETLLTTPVSPSQVVLAKFFAAYLLYAVFWLLTLGFSAILHSQARDPRLWEIGPTAGGYLFILLSGLLFVAIGIFASSLTRNQLVSGILSFTLLFGVIIGSRYLADLTASGLQFLPVSDEWLAYPQVFQHGEDFSRGVFDTRPIAFYLSTAALFLILSVLTIESKIWRS